MALSVAVIDDSPIIRDRLADTLADIPDVDVLWTAATAEDGLEEAARRPPDVVVLDVRLPGASGIDVLPQLADRLPAALLIVLTNYPHAEHGHQALRRGATHFFDKSKDLDELRRVIEERAGGDHA